MNNIKQIQQIQQRIKYLEECQKKFSIEVNEIQNTSKDMLKKLLEISKLTNSMPNEISHRKINLQKLINYTLSGIDGVVNELTNSSFDCGILLMREKRSLKLENDMKEYLAKQEKENEKRANAFMAE